MENKLIIISVGVFIFLLIISAFMSFRSINLTSNVVKETDSMEGHHSGSSNSMASHHSEDSKKISSLDAQDLSKYRSENIPVDCRLPDYDDDVAKWAEHLGHHKETQYCLEYYNKESTSQVSESSLNSSNIPEKCRQPSGSDLNSWKEHLGHHQETEECLKYFD